MKKTAFFSQKCTAATPLLCPVTNPRQGGLKWQSISIRFRIHHNIIVATSKFEIHVQWKKSQFNFQNIRPIACALRPLQGLRPVPQLRCCGALSTTLIVWYSI